MNNPRIRGGRGDALYKSTVDIDIDIDSNSMQWTKISSIRSQQLAFPTLLSLTATDINKLQTVFDEDTIFCKSCNLRF